MELLPNIASGDLRDSSVVEVVAAAFRAHATGTIAVEQGKGESRLFMRYGAPSGASLYVGGQSFSAFLIERGALSADDAERCVAIARKQNERLGAVLVAQELFSHEVLIQLVIAHQEAVITELCLLREGKYELRGWERPPEWTEELTVDPLRTITSALAADELFDRRSSILELLGQTRLQRAGDFDDLAGRLMVEADDQTLLRELPGAVTTEDLVGQLGHHDDAEAYLCAVALLGLLEPEREAPEQAPSTLDAAFLLKPIEGEEGDASFILSPIDEQESRSAPRLAAIPSIPDPDPNEDRDEQTVSLRVSRGERIPPSPSPPAHEPRRDDTPGVAPKATWSDDMGLRLDEALRAVIAPAAPPAPAYTPPLTVLPMPYGLQGSGYAVPGYPPVQQLVAPPTPQNPLMNNWRPPPPTAAPLQPTPSPAQRVPGLEPSGYYGNTKAPSAFDIDDLGLDRPEPTAPKPAFKPAPTTSRTVRGEVEFEASDADEPLELDMQRAPPELLREQLEAKSPVRKPSSGSSRALNAPEPSKPSIGRASLAAPPSAEPPPPRARKADDYNPFAVHFRKTGSAETTGESIDSRLERALRGEPVASTSRPPSRSERRSGSIPRIPTQPILIPPAPPVAPRTSSAPVLVPPISDPPAPTPSGPVLVPPVGIGRPGKQVVAPARGGPPPRTPTTPILVPSERTASAPQRAVSRKSQSVPVIPPPPAGRPAGHVPTDLELVQAIIAAKQNIMARDKSGKVLSEIIDEVGAVPEPEPEPLEIAASGRILEDGDGLALLAAAEAARDALHGSAANESDANEEEAEAELLEPDEPISEPYEASDDRYEEPEPTPEPEPEPVEESLPPVRSPSPANGAKALKPDDPPRSSPKAPPPASPPPATESSQDVRRRLLQRALRNVGGPTFGRETTGRVGVRAPDAPVPRPSNADTDFERDIAARLSNTADQDHFGRLEISRSATTEDVKEAFLSLAKRYHPDKLSALGQAHLVPQGRELFARIKDAYDVLVDPASRAKYIAELDAKAAPKAKLSPEQAKTSFQMAQHLLRKRDFRGAEVELNRAIDADPQPEYLAELAWSMYSNASRRDETRDQVKSLIARALKSSTESDRAYVVAAHVARGEGEPPEKVERLFRKAVERNPKNIEAARELRLIETRRGPEPKKNGSGLFDRLRGK